MPAAGLIATTAAPCEVHKQHYPKPTYQEEHHVVPQAWQQVWKPAVAPHPGQGTDGRMLWDARKVNVCRTGHGNVHHWLVLAMQAHEKQGGDNSTEAIAAAIKAATANTNGRVRAEVEVARQAMVRWVEAGGDLRLLTAQGLYGYI